MVSTVQLRFDLKEADVWNGTDENE
jgi:hypothetical protein